jgi:hypothetical protein
MAGCAALTSGLGAEGGSAFVAAPIPSGRVVLAGSRALPLWGALLVEAVVARLLAGGSTLAVGCCVGADEVALGACPASRVQVLCALGPAGAGAGSWSAVAPVCAHQRAGGRVTWWAGGGPRVPLRRRLAARSGALAQLATAGAVVFLGSPNSRGSLIVASEVARRGLPVVGFPLGFPAEALPRLTAQGGAWVPAGEGVWGFGWRWVEGGCSEINV